MTNSKTNLYWAIYKNIEKEIIDLSFKISFDDINFDNKIHSMGIADLILRIASQIESIAKDLYFENGGTGNRDKVSYDYNCLYKIFTDWNMKSREIMLIMPTQNLTKQEYIKYKPFYFLNNKRTKYGNRPI